MIYFAVFWFHSYAEVTVIVHYINVAVQYLSETECIIKYNIFGCDYVHIAVLENHNFALKSPGFSSIETCMNPVHST